MKKLLTLLMLLLCAALLFPCALAEESDVYTPGEITRAALDNAWDSGKLLSADLSMRMKADPAFFGLTEEETSMFSAACEALEHLTLNIAAGMTGDMLRLEAGATLAHAQGGNPVAVSAAANLDLYGLSLESSLLPDRKVTAKWETLLALTGMSESNIAMILGLRDFDWESFLATLLTELEAYLTKAIELAAPYAETAGAWLSTLTVETLENVAATDGLPAAAQVINIYLCEKDVGNLISALADTLENDETLTLLIDTTLAESAAQMGEEAPTTAEIISEMRSAAADMTDTENPIMFALGMDADGMPLYGEIYVIDSSDAGLYGAIIVAPTETGANCTVSLMMIEPDGSVSDGASFEIAVSGNALSTLGQVFACGEPVLGYNQDVTFARVTTEDGLPGFSAEQTLTMNMVDGSSEIQMLMNSSSQFACTADGGETSDVTVSMDMYADGQAISLTTLMSTALLMKEDGSFSYITGMTESIPSLGFETLGFDLVITPRAYDPAVTAALAETALETASSEAMEALGQSLFSAAQLKAMEALQALPTELLTQLMGIL